MTQYYKMHAVDPLTDRTIATEYFPIPKRIANPGDVLVFRRPCIAKSGSKYEIGDTLELLERTEMAPWGIRSGLGNFTVQCKDRMSVWSNIEMMIAAGHVEYLDKVTVDSDDIWALRDAAKAMLDRVNVLTKGMKRG